MPAAILDPGNKDGIAQGHSQWSVGGLIPNVVDLKLPSTGQTDAARWQSTASCRTDETAWGNTMYCDCGKNCAVAGVGMMG